MPKAIIRLFFIAIKKKLSAYMMYGLVAFFVLLGGCNKTTRTTPRVVGERVHFVNQSSGLVVSDDRALQEALMVDIPLPLGVFCYEGLNTDILDATHDLPLLIDRISYQTPQQLQEFYGRAMEQCGWHLLSLYTHKLERLVLCSKPRQICVVSLRPCTIGSRVGTQLRIMVTSCVATEPLGGAL